MDEKIQKWSASIPCRHVAKNGRCWAFQPGCEQRCMLYKEWFSQKPQEEDE